MSATEQVTLGNVVGGEAAESVAGRLEEVVNPATEETIARVPLGDLDDVARAVAAASAAAPAWGRTTPADRATALLALADLLDEHADELTDLEVANAGKPRAADADEALAWANDCAYGLASSVWTQRRHPGAALHPGAELRLRLGQRPHPLPVGDAPRRLRHVRLRQGPVGVLAGGVHPRQARHVQPGRVMSTTATAISRERIAELTARESKALDARTQGSGRMYERARGPLAAGVASTYQVRDPWPIYLERGDGPKVWDVDGNEMWDFHNGFGSMVQGHAHPAIGEAIAARYAQGTHFAAPDRGRDRRRRGARSALRPAALALHELRVGVDDGRHPHRSRAAPAATTCSRSSAPTTATTTP